MGDPASSYPSYRDAPPKLIGGAGCLDFLNTVEWRGDPSARGERLTDFEEFVVWAGRAGYLDAAEQTQARKAARLSPKRAHAALGDACALREGIAAVVRRETGAVAAFNDLLRRLQLHVELAADAEGLRAAATGDALRTALPRIALDALTLLSSARLAQVRSCGNERCGWFFLDLSRNRSRRWCDMAACGNNAKARAHYHRHHA